MRPRETTALLIPLLAATLCLGSSALAAAPVTASRAENAITIGNGVVSLVISTQSGTATALRYRHNGVEKEIGSPGKSVYFDFNGAPTNPPPGLTLPRAGYGMQTVRSVSITQHSPATVEIVSQGEPTPTFPFATELHYRLQRGDSGFYAWVIFRHDRSMPAAGLGQSRIVVRGVPGPGIFTHHIVDDVRKGPYPTSPSVRTLQDATDLLADGTIYTKYDNTAFMADHRLHGMTGHGIGMWVITPSNEYVNGGPLKQNLTVHTDNVLLSTFETGHFGSGSLDFAEGEEWSKCFGPFFVYVNQGASMDALYADARKRSNAESRKWPYRFALSAVYPVERGAVSGRLEVTDGRSARNAWVILAAPGGNWPLQGKGYQFWTKADAKGRFTIPKVRAGSYTLYAVGANEFQQFSRDNVVVSAGKRTNLGALSWTPVKHGTMLWQIGTPDRSTAEFRRGDDVRHFGNFRYYVKDFPEDIAFTIGRSREKTDWNFAHWSWYAARPYWTIRFDTDKQYRGEAVLTFGIAASLPLEGKLTDVRVGLNGTEIGALRLPKSGAAAYRSGGQDSDYRVATVKFDAALLKPGLNEITLAHAGAAPYPSAEEPVNGFGAIMYDAIRLEVE